MAITLNGKPVNPNRAFTLDGIQYPANWYRLASAEERTALGFAEVSDPTPVDQRFYWSADNPKDLEDVDASDINGNPLYVQVWDADADSMVDTEERLVTKGLKSQWTAQVKDTANKLLASTDWYVVRKYERNIDVPTNVATFRNAIIDEATRLETAISEATDIDEFISVVTAQNWPKLK